MSGCPLGDRFPGWRILIEAFYLPEPGRTYGSLTYGDEIYGDASGNVARWIDITPAAFELTLQNGAANLTPPIPVNELTISFHDEAGALWDYASPARLNLPFVHSPLRVGLLDPAAGYHPLAYGLVETIEDVHETPPRLVNVTAYGNVSRLVAGRAGWARPAETSSERIRAIIAEAPEAIPWTAPGAAVALLADTGARTIELRDELDRTAASAGWAMAEDPEGAITFLGWPIPEAGARIDATDCHEADNPAALLAGSVTYSADTASILNYAQIVNTAGTIVERVDEISRAKYGEHSQTFGFPGSGLAFADTAAAQTIVDHAVNRWANVVTHLDAVNVDTHADRRWLEALADLRIGRPLRMDRRGIRPFTLDTLVTGWTLTLVPNRVTASIYTTTITPTL